MVDKTKKLIFVSALVLSIMGAGVYGAKSAFAQGTAMQSNLVEKIADKFGLKVEDVQAVFEQERQEREAAMEAKYEQSLTDAVTSGNLTETQKQLLLVKHKELRANRQSQMQTFQTLTQEQRKAAMKKERTEIEAWAKENNINMKYLMWGGHGRGHSPKPNSQTNTQ